MACRLDSSQHLLRPFENLGSSLIVWLTRQDLVEVGGLPDREGLVHDRLAKALRQMRVRTRERNDELRGHVTRQSPLQNQATHRFRKLSDHPQSAMDPGLRASQTKGQLVQTQVMSIHQRFDEPALFDHRRGGPVHCSTKLEERIGD